MADPESKKAPRPSTRPHKPLPASAEPATPKDDIFDALDILETTVTQVKNSGPPPPPPSRAPSGPPPLPSAPPRSRPGAHLTPPPPPSEGPPRTDAPAESTAPAATFAGEVAKTGEPAQPAEAPHAGDPTPSSDTAKPSEPEKPAEIVKLPAVAKPPAAPIATAQLEKPAPPASFEPSQESPALLETEFERLKGEVAKLRQERPRFGGGIWPLVTVALLAATAGYLLGDSIESRSRAEVRKVAMDRYYAAQSRPADEQKEVLTFIQKELTKDDPELARWAKSQVSVIEERLLALAEREAALKVRVVELKGELDRQVTRNLELEADKARLESQIVALNSVEKKLTRLKESNALLVQAKAGIERLHRQLSDIEETPEAKQVAP